MQKKILSILKYVLFLGLGVFLVWWSLHKIPDKNWPFFKQAILSAKYWIIIPVFFILITSHILRAYRWRMLMYPLGYKPTFANTFFAVMIGYLANMAVPRLGEVLKCTILARYEKVPADKLVGTIVAERAFDILFLLLVFLLAFIFQYDIVSHYSSALFKKAFASGNGSISVLKIFAVVLVVVFVLAFIRAWFNRNRHLSFIVSIKQVLKGVWQGLVSVKHLHHKWPFLLASIGIWSLYIAGTWLGFYATAGTENLGVDVAIAALAFGSVGMILTPGGFGSYAIFIALILEKNHVTREIALANGNLQWFAQFLIVLLVGFLSLLLLPYFNKHLKVHASNQHHTPQDLPIS